jgi:hypothetical protein
MDFYIIYYRLPTTNPVAATAGSCIDCNMLKILKLFPTFRGAWIVLSAPDSFFYGKKEYDDLWHYFLKLLSPLFKRVNKSILAFYVFIDVNSVAFLQKELLYLHTPISLLHLVKKEIILLFMFLNSFILGRIVLPLYKFSRLITVVYSFFSY